jgi:hypothetical protein
MASLQAMPNPEPDLGSSAAFAEPVFYSHELSLTTEEYMRTSFAVLPCAFHGFVLLVFALLSMYSLGHNSRVGFSHQNRRRFGPI